MIHLNKMTRVTCLKITNPFNKNKGSLFYRDDPSDKFQWNHSRDPFEVNDLTDMFKDNLTHLIKINEV